MQKAKTVSDLSVFFSLSIAFLSLKKSVLVNRRDGAISPAIVMSGQFSNSPRGEDKDVEAGISSFTEYEDSPFDITNTKNAPVERLRRWRVNGSTSSLYRCIDLLTAFQFFFLSSLVIWINFDVHLIVN